MKTYKELTKITNYLKNEFEMKDLRKQNFILTYRSMTFQMNVSSSINIYKKKVLECFYINKSHPLNSSMVVYSLEVKNELFCPKENNEGLLSPKASYLNYIGTIVYLVNCT